MSDLSLAKIAESGSPISVDRKHTTIEDNPDGSQTVYLSVELNDRSLRTICFKLTTDGQKVDYHAFGSNRIIDSNLITNVAGGVFVNVNEESRFCMVVSQKQYPTDFGQKRFSSQLHVLKVDPDDPNIQIVSPYPPYNEHILENEHLTGAGIRVEGYIPLSNQELEIKIEREKILISTT